MSDMKTLQDRINKKADCELKERIDLAVGNFCRAINPAQQGDVTVVPHTADKPAVTVYCQSLIRMISDHAFAYKKEKNRSLASREFLDRLEQLVETHNELI